MDKILKDSRFAKIGTDKRFMTVSKKQKKVKIDKRFKSMFEDEKFVSKCAVDKRGRPTNYTSKENYKKYYDLKDSDESESDSDSDEKNLTGDVKLPDKLESDEDSLIGSFSKTPDVQTATSEDDDQSGDDDDENVDKENLSSEPGRSQDYEVIDPKVKSKLLDSNVDYARGEAALYSSDDDSSSGEDSSEDEREDTVEMFDNWGELDKDAETTEETTKRLAVCNMNWDRVKAEDIFLVMSSFCSGGGSVTSVRIYMSDFGKERLAEEDNLGPTELRGEAVASDDEDGGDLVGDMDEKMTETMALNRVRQYQINKLKYYYAVVEFDTPETANMVYTECDGKEYELSASRFDLRFIPDDMVFEAEPTSSCLSPPTPESYKPKLFFTTALQQGRVDLTWDEDDPERAVAMRKAYELEDGDIGDVKAFLASDSDDDDEVDKKESRIAPPSDEDSNEDESECEDKDTIEKYRALIADITENEERKSSAKGNMEVSWEENKTVDDPEEEIKELTPWEKYLKKKKDKRSKKMEKYSTKTEGKEDAISDDELPEGVDIDDPFFADELKKSTKKEKKVKTKKKPLDTSPTEGEAPNGLDLIVMDSDDDRQHFDFKQIRETENVDASKSKKKKWSKKKKKVEGSIPSKKEKDGFKVDVKDDRFSALFSSANYNIDPSDPYFKRTNAMDDLINEKQKRRKERKPDVIDQHVTKKKSKLDPELSQSLKSVKSKWQKNAKRKSGNTFIVKDI